MSEKMIPHNKPFIEKGDIGEVQRALESEWVIHGPRVETFEKDLARYIGVRGGVAVNSGTSAIHLSLLALGVGKGDEVIIPTYVCTAVLNAVNYVGAKPVVVDVDSKDYNISLEQTKKHITKNTKAIIVPHMFGIPADIDKFQALGIPIIEDCAQSIGAKYKGKMIGSFGDLSIFSFYGSKLLTTGYGGLVCSNNKPLLDTARDLRDFDYRKDYKVRYNYQMSDINAALGISQLRKLPQMLERRKKIAERYDRALATIGMSIYKEEPNKERVYYRYVINTRREDGVRSIPENVHVYINKLEDYGIKTIKPICEWELLHNYLGMNNSQFPVAEKFARTGISIPIYPALTDEDVNYICSKIGDLELWLYDNW